MYLVLFHTSRHTSHIHAPTPCEVLRLDYFRYVKSSTFRPSCSIASTICQAPRRSRRSEQIREPHRPLDISPDFSYRCILIPVDTHTQENLKTNGRVTSSMNLSSLSSSLLHPISLIVFEILTNAGVLAFTSPSSIFRPAALLLVVIAAWLALSTCGDYMPRFWATGIAGNAPTYLLRYIDLALLGKWSFAAGGPTSLTAGWNDRRVNKDVERRATTWGRFSWGISTTVFPRLIDTPLEVKNVPRFSGGKP